MQAAHANACAAGLVLLLVLLLLLPVAAVLRPSLT
jgi:hypothetical protein